jgi:type VI secretion system secreted protein VgrG
MAVLTTPLGDDQLVVVRFDGTEGVSELFEFRIEALSTMDDIDFDELIGKNVTLSINSPSEDPRHFDGILTEAQWLGSRDNFNVYQLVLRPWFWLMSHRSDCFIFHEKKVTDVVSDVFHRHSFADIDDRTSGSYEPMEYCVQYRESDMAFVSRLLEQYGISYFFTHEEGSHKLVLTDQNSQFEPAPGSSRRYIGHEVRDRRPEECISHFMPERRFTAGRVTLRDYNFKKPTTPMEAEHSGTASYEHAGMELYDYPGKYVQRSEGNEIATWQLQGEEALDKRCRASGDCMSLFAGCLVQLQDHSPKYDKEYVVLRARHSFTSQQYRSGQGGGDGDAYVGQYELLDSDIPFRPQEVTEKALVKGLQTAIVVGPDGEEIDCDEYGRILVRFHWDRENDQSMRCRVSQNWAFQHWGGMVIPRIGMEVVVEFLEGDPDRPLVTGCVYNGDNMPPYQLSANKTRSTFKTKSHKADGYNELRFEDEKDEEEVWFHAQKYHNGVVEEDETWEVVQNRHTRVGGSYSQSIGKDQDLEVENDRREHVMGASHHAIERSRVASVGGNDYLTVTGNQTSQIDANKSVKVIGELTVDALSQLSNASTMQTIQGGVSVNIVAGLTLTLSAGPSTITLSPAGVSIDGPVVMLNCGGAPMTLTPVTPTNVQQPESYQGPHAKRYERSYKT